jgi:hypothetical protein
MIYDKIRKSFQFPSRERLSEVAPRRPKERNRLYWPNGEAIPLACM